MLDPCPGIQGGGWRMHELISMSEHHMFVFSDGILPRHVFRLVIGDEECNDFA